ncbi:hypothetical protein NUU61_009298 [Penicillium alfredii]|uniref:37S ribosomal protein mrp10, mitochondrial n=1 Tax=Penicillium alfredii TaxID=1506179 RepID=A0A9W9JWS1_9EURO|nr:uncharacterized protein NUU61_009298 [Penicillium alfredii]KAJ5084719.1 hypothetical protein NUU61_009298 [Penicillium alfredii]
MGSNPIPTWALPFWSTKSSQHAVRPSFLSSAFRSLNPSSSANMPPKGNVSTKLKPMRLDTIRFLRVKRPNTQQEQNPCVTVMSSMLNCWASQGYGTEGCAAMEMQLRKCMDGTTKSEKKNNTVNYHLGRMYPKVIPPRKKEGVLG